MDGKGSALIEVLAAMAILAIGIFASATLVLHSQKNILLQEESQSSRMIASSFFSRLQAGQIDFSSDWQKNMQSQLDEDCRKSACMEFARFSVSDWHGGYRINLSIEAASGRIYKYVHSTAIRK